MSRELDEKKDNFKEFILEQLEEAGTVNCRSMFGGYGLYSDSTFFGIIHRGQLYYKTDRNTRQDYISVGTEPFRPNKKQTLKTYFEVPADILEDRAVLTEWAEKAIACKDTKQH